MDQGQISPNFRKRVKTSNLAGKYSVDSDVGAALPFGVCRSKCGKGQNDGKGSPPLGNSASLFFRYLPEPSAAALLDYLLPVELQIVPFFVPKKKELQISFPFTRCGAERPHLHAGDHSAIARERRGAPIPALLAPPRSAAGRTT